MNRRGYFLISILFHPVLIFIMSYHPGTAEFLYEKPKVIDVMTVDNVYFNDSPIGETGVIKDRDSVRGSALGKSVKSSTSVENPATPKPPPPDTAPRAPSAGMIRNENKFAAFIDEKILETAANQAKQTTDG